MRATGLNSSGLLQAGNYSLRTNWRRTKPRPSAANLKQRQQITNQELLFGRYLNAAVNATKPRIAQIIIISVAVIAPVPRPRWLNRFETSGLTKTRHCPKSFCQIEAPPGPPRSICSRNPHPEFQVNAVAIAVGFTNTVVVRAGALGSPFAPARLTSVVRN